MLDMGMGGTKVRNKALWKYSANFLCYLDDFVLKDIFEARLTMNSFTINSFIMNCFTMKGFKISLNHS